MIKLSPVPLVVCREPKVQDRELVISWRYAHTGGLNITSTLVLYSNDSTTYAPLPSSGSGSSGSGSGSRGYYPPDTSVSIPLPVAGVTYYFRVMASNDEGSTTSDCLGFFLTTGNVLTSQPILCIKLAGSLNNQLPLQVFHLSLNSQSLSLAQMTE